MKEIIFDSKLGARSRPYNLHIRLVALLFLTEFPFQFVGGFFKATISENTPICSYFRLFTEVFVTNIYEVPIMYQPRSWTAQV